MDTYAQQLMNYVIRPTLEHLGVANVETKAWLLLGTATVVSQLPAVMPWSERYGIYAITHEDHFRIWDGFLAKNADLASTVRGLASQHHFLQQPDAELNTNLAYATAIAIMFYEEVIPVWPVTTDPACLAALWSQGFAPHMDGDESQFCDLLAQLQHQHQHQHGRQAA